MAEQKTHINPTTKAQVPALHLYFDERDNRTEETQDYSPKGFTEETVLNDFPVRDKKLVLLSEERAPRSVSISPSQTRLQELQRTRVMMLPIVSDLVVEDILMDPSPSVAQCTMTAGTSRTAAKPISPKVRSYMSPNIKISQTILYFRECNRCAPGFCLRKEKSPHHLDVGYGEVMVPGYSTKDKGGKASRMVPRSELSLQV